RKEVHHTHGYRRSRYLQTDPLIGKDWRQIFKTFSSLCLVRLVSVDRFHIEKGAVFLVLGLHSSIAHQDIAGLQIKSPDLRRRDIYVIFSRQIILTADKSKTVRHHFQDTVCLLAAVEAFQLTLHAIFRAAVFLSVMSLVSIGRASCR